MRLLSRRTAAAAAALLGREAGAQSCNTNPCTVPVTATLSVNAAARLSLSSAATPLDAPRAADFAAGSRNTPGPTVTVQANTGVRVTVASTAATWTRNGGASTKPVGDLRWATSAAGPYAALATTAGAGSLLSTAATAGASQQVFYQALWRWTQDAPGTYSLPVVFTLVAP